MNAQPALFHGPNAFGAVQIWRGEFDERALLKLAGDRVLIGVAAETFLPLAHGDFRFPSTQASALVQVGAPSREVMLDDLRKVEALLRAGCYLDEEVVGGRIADNREPFGFKDGLRPPTREDVERLAIKDGQSFLLYQRYEQDLERFARLRDPLAVFGVTREGAPLPHPTKEAHVPRAKEWGKLIRRGFPFRKNGAEGLIFIAAAREIAVFERALRAMLDPPEALLRYATAVSGGIYRVPAV